jgi:DNA-directed RNA polymerase subunit E'/Rpb7
MISTDGSGRAVFTLTYRCIVMRPFPGEVVDCEVVSVNQVDLKLHSLPLQLLQTVGSCATL